MRTIDLIRTTKIERVVQESSNIKSFYFRDVESMSSLPGQFAMIWLPGVGEFPMSHSLNSKGLASIAVKGMGEGSNRLYESEKGGILGIRGPYGNSFNVPKRVKRALLVGGGTGMVPLVRLAEELAKWHIKASMVIGAKTNSEIPFLRASKEILGTKNVFPSTDDGSFGFKGLATEQAEVLLKKAKFDMIFSCGPEKMMFALFGLAKKYKVSVQFSMERIMKCGIGICGSCTVGDLVLCRDGPILSSTQLASLGNEFGNLHRDKTGKLANVFLGT